MEKVLVTGSFGRLGRWTVDMLTDDGYTVVGVDKTHPGSGARTRDNVELKSCDLSTQGAIDELIHEVNPDAVVHLAAIPNPEVYPGTQVFENNVMSTYNVLNAAGKETIPVTWASSESAYGFPFAEEPVLPDYLPIDEAHPLRPEDPYGSSKLVSEDIADVVTRRYDIPIASLRISNVQYPGEYTVLDGRDSLRNGVGNFWSYVDGRDVANAVVRTLEADLSGHESFVIAADDNYLGRPTTEAVEEFFGGLPDAVSVSGEDSALSSEKAKHVLGWNPNHTWRTAADENQPVPTLTK
ncbi:NAD-dependent epimerase/dehydratase family protein [Haladaptatus caseinilyticus]|uniref:NAD-dependent epimerase/dehydratase family protein n=1 Tax=Haladaptatus caseinilyticus TaxID=2993314 RepID=UPI00224B77DD|nr:NAD(P)-dependent oxidoreductase [Haladaptatus caseinilyticus]